MPNLVDTFILQGPEHALEFMVAFGRLEYALKTMNHIGDASASVSWKYVPARLDRMVSRETEHSSLYEYVAERAEENSAIAYLLNHPARDLTYRNGRIEWGDEYEVRSTDDLLWAIKHTRNNLFHGGKYHPGDDWDRNLTLILGSLQVIKLMLEVDAELRKAFWGD